MKSINRKDYMSNTLKSFKIANIIASCVVVIGLFPAWLISRGFGMTIGANAFHLIYNPTGVIIIICAITAILFTSISLIKSNKATKILAGIINLICSLIMALMVVACFSVTFDRLKYISDGNPGFGIFLSTIGVVSVLVTSICILATKDRKTSKKDSSKKK